MKTGLTILVAVAALVAGVLLRQSVDTAAAAPDRTIVLPAKTFPDLLDRPQSLQQWQGRVVVLNFWATWCPPCLEEMPVFSKIQQELADKGLQVVGVAIDEPGAVREFLATTPVSYPALIAEEEGTALAASFGNTSNILPFTAIFDRSGHLLIAHAGPLSREGLLKLLDGALRISTTPDR